MQGSQRASVASGVLCALLTGCCCGLAASQGEVANVHDIEQKGTLKLLWPIHVSAFPLSATDRKSLDGPEVGRKMSKIALDKFHDYRANILPQELKQDKVFAAEWKRSDHSRLNLGFRRWQLRVFSEFSGIAVEKLNAQGESAPKLDGINYTWPELYDSAVYKLFRTRASESVKLYLRRTGYDTKNMKLLIFFWAELFERGEMLRPFARTDGAYAMGRYFATMRPNAHKFNFEDPRGINPPFGKTFSNHVYEGELLVFPTWVSQFVTPNMHNDTSVTYSFVAYPADGNSLDWRKDKTAHVVHERSFTIKKGNKRGR